MSIQLKTHSSLIRSLEHAFNDNFAFVRELAQNSRRAGADRIEIEFYSSARELVITDNGSGIEDMQMLFHIGKSGWGQSTQDEEHPYGLGFLAAVYAATHVSIVSGHRGIEFDTEDLLSGRSFEEFDTIEQVDGTKITLSGIKDQDLSSVDFEAKMLRWFAGFPVVVIYNGEILERPDARDFGIYNRIPGVGDCRVSQSVRDRQWGREPEFAVQAYYQGFPVIEACANKENISVVHLYQKYFTAKLPDRASLRNPQESEDTIREGVLALVKRKLETSALHQDLSRPEVFKTLRAYKMLDLYNNVDVLPAVSNITGTSQSPRVSGVHSSPPTVQHLTRSALAGKLLWCSPSIYGYLSESHMSNWQMLYQLSEVGSAVHVDPRSLDINHWLNRMDLVMMRSWESLDSDIELTVYGEVVAIGEFEDVEVFNCDTLAIQGHGHVLNSSTWPFLQDNKLYIPAGCNDWTQVAQLVGDLDLAAELRQLSHRTRATTPAEKLLVSLSDVNTDGLDDGTFTITLEAGKFTVAE